MAMSRAMETTGCATVKICEKVPRSCSHDEEVKSAVPAYCSRLAFRQKLTGTLPDCAASTQL